MPSPPQLEAKGQRVHTGTEGPVELCAGTLRAWDDHVAFVEQQLEIYRDPDDPLEVYMVADATPWCEEVMACYIGGFTDATFVPRYAPQAVWHELVHHVVSGSNLGLTDRFLSEGVAGALGDNWCPAPGQKWPQPPLVTMFARDDIEYEHYPRAAQFVDWVRQEHGTAALVQLIECIDRGDPLSEVDACMVRVLGEDLVAVSDHFDEAAPPFHANPAVCGGEALAPRGERWAFDVTLDCSNPAVRNGFRSPHDRLVDVLIDIPKSGNYEVRLRGEGEATVELEPCFCLTTDEGLLHVPGEDAFWVGEAGRYRLTVRTDDPTTSQISVVVAPVPDHTPARSV